MKTTLMMLIILYKQNVEIKNLLQKQFSSIYKNLCTYTLQIIRYVLIVLNKKQMIKTLIKQSNMEPAFLLIMLMYVTLLPMVFWNPLVFQNKNYKCLFDGNNEYKSY
jgi:hypothetical protein